MRFDFYEYGRVSNASSQLNTKKRKNFIADS